jgi:D-tyrosyl-tRNA(Tyr) deacylase
MRAVIQVVSEASVKVAGELISEIKKGYLILLAVHVDDTEDKINKMAEKIINLRIFPDENDKINLNIKDVDGEILLVSQFTLYGDVKKGNRPSFIESARPEQANAYYEILVGKLREFVPVVKTGRFGAHMSVSLINDGPCTIIIDL